MKPVTLVVDASVALKWFLKDRDEEAVTDAATDILEAFVAGEVQLLATCHFQAEVCALLARETPQALMAQSLRSGTRSQFI